MPADALGRLAEPFLSRLLPAMLRRLAAWRRFPAGEVAEILQELRQEVHLDCLEHPEVIADLDPRQRHARWFRMAERWIYRHRAHSGLTGLDAAALPASPPLESEVSEPQQQQLRRLLPDLDEPTLRGLLQHSQQHRNGRCHLKATAQGLGTHPQKVRKLWERAAHQSGFGEAFLQFWRRRLAEALVGLAADLLRDRGQVDTIDRERSLPNPLGRLRRVQQIRERMRVRPLPRDVRSVLARVLATRDPMQLCPVDLLQKAEQLGPRNASAQLWLFEATVAAGRVRLAAAAVRRAARAGADPVQLTLARARLLQARGQDVRAARLLQRASRRRPDRRLRAALQCACS